MKLLNHSVAVVLSLMLLFTPVLQAQAALFTNAQLIDQVQLSGEKDALLQTLHRDDVKAQLLELGVDTANIETRINQMTQQEIAQLNQQLNDLPAGSGVLGFVLVIFIVFVITDVIGATDIFPFIHPVR